MGNKFSRRFRFIRKIKGSGYLDLLSSYNFQKKEYFDESEHSIHALGRELFQGNFNSPIKDILSNPNSKILDVGCGPGFWLIEMSADFPKPKYVGVDMAPVFPNFTPPDNVKFVRHDFLTGLPFDDDTFDFIYIRSLSYEFTELQWETFVYQELARLLKPGGWLEVWDYDMELTNPGPTLSRVNLTIRNALTFNNINPSITKRHPSLIKSILSFSSSTLYHEKRILHYGSHGLSENKLGEFSAQLALENLRYIFQGPIGQIMKIKREDIDSVIDTIRSEFELYHPYTHVHGFYVQKMSKDDW